VPQPPKEPPNPGGGSGIGGLDVPQGQDKPNDQTALKTDETKTASTESKDTKTNQNQQNSGTQTQEKPQTPVRATRDPATGKLILDGTLGDQSMRDNPPSSSAPQVATATGTALIDPKTVSDAQLKALLADPQFRSRVAKALADDAGKQAVSASRGNVKANAAQKPANANTGVSPGDAAAGVLLGVGVGIGLGRTGGRMGGDR
jgi:hypothetical protein